MSSQTKAEGEESKTSVKALAAMFEQGIQSQKEDLSYKKP